MLNDQLLCYDAALMCYGCDRGMSGDRYSKIWSFGSTGLSPLVVAESLFLKDVEVVTISFGKSDGGLLVTDDEEVGGSGGEGLAIVILQVHDIITSEMLFNMQDLTNSADVVSSSNVGKMSRLVLVELNNLVLLKIELDSITLRNLRVGETDSSGVMSDNIGFFVGTNHASANLEKLGFGLSILEFKESEASLDIIEQAVALVGLGEGDDIHDTNGELHISSDSVVDLNACFFVLDDDIGFAASEGKLEMMPG